MDDKTQGKDFARFDLRAIAAELPETADTLLIRRRAAADPKDVIFVNPEDGTPGKLH